jgi:carboxyl-terminal processing protease
MNPAKKSLLSAGAIVLCCGAVLAGTLSRNSTDRHQPAFDLFASNHRLLASNSNDQGPAGSAGDYYEFVTELLKKNYVDPVNDERKLSTGAIRGMILFLDNPDCRFFDPDEYRAYAEAEAGKFQGIGVTLGYKIPSRQDLAAALSDVDASLMKSPDAQLRKSAQDAVDLDPDSDTDSTHVPAVVVESVVPGSPADRAGVKVGDSLNSINGMWVVNPYEINALSVVTQAVNRNQASRDTLLALRRDLRKKLKSSLTPAKALNKVTMGTSGLLKIDWMRGRTLVPTSIARGVTTEDSVTREAGGVLALHLIPGAGAKLKSELGGGPITLDLRNNTLGDYDELKACLEDLAPAGSYGKFVNYKSKPAKTLTTTSGSKPRSIKILVDGSTSGLSEVLALALQSKGYAKLQGPPMAQDKNLVQLFKLSDGSGYSLVTGSYQTGAEQTRRGA